MIRRGFWVATGAVLGVTGYRRATKLARMLSGPSRPSRPSPRLKPVARRSQVARAIAAAGFVRDVRDGMAEYWDLHRGEPGAARIGRTLESRTLGIPSDRTLSGAPAGSGQRQQGRREL